MLPPDEYAVIRPFDNLVQWLHDWGVDRNTVLRAAGVIAALSSTWNSFQTTANPLWMTSILSALIVLIIIFPIHFNETRSKSRYFNFSQLSQRDGGLAWMRFVMWAWLLVFCGILDLASLWATVVYVAFFYFTYTLKPIDDPKHHWRELFSKRIGASI